MGFIRVTSVLIKPGQTPGSSHTRTDERTLHWRHHHSRSPCTEEPGGLQSRGRKELDETEHMPYGREQGRSVDIRCDLKVRI